MDGDPETPADERAPRRPSDAFQTLGNDVRMRTVRTLLESGPCSFSQLYEESGVDTSAGFAYHLRQLDGEFVRKRDDDRYELTYAGREVGRAIRAGTYTDSVDRDRLELDDPCPFCAEPALAARVADNVSRIACEGCHSPVLELSFPPSGYATRETDSIPHALDAYHRHRIQAFTDGVCPSCGGASATTVEPAGDDRSPQDADGYEPVQLSFGCDACSIQLRCPVSLALLAHPAVVSFYHEHGEDVRERPLWNVGAEWRERVISREPWCVVVSTRLEDDSLSLYVGGDGTVVETRRYAEDQSGRSERVGEPDDEPSEEGATG